MASNSYIGRKQIKAPGAFGRQRRSKASNNEVDSNDFDDFNAAVVDVMLRKRANATL